MNKKKKIMVVFGTRPEAIKMAPLVQELKKNKIPNKVVVTGQHREMLDQVLKIFKIKPDYDLNIMLPQQTIFDVTSNTLLKIKSVIEKESPSLVLVHGDTSTAFSSALAAYYQKTPVGHVEAGLRTYDKYNPFPEEINRQLIDRLSDFLFCPTKQNKENLEKENIKKNIFITGNTVIDAVKHIAHQNIDFEEPILKNIDFEKRTILLTCHRRESIGRPMKDMFSAIKKIVDKTPDIQVVFPVHLNPLVQKMAHEVFDEHPRIFLTKPVGYTDMINLMKKSYLIATDSGGIQEEAPTFHKPVLVLRNETERGEGVEAGTLKLVGTSPQNVFKNLKEILNDPEKYKKISKSTNPYGIGNSSKKIVKIITQRKIR